MCRKCFIKDKLVHIASKRRRSKTYFFSVITRLPWLVKNVSPDRQEKISISICDWFSLEIHTCCSLFCQINLDSPAALDVLHHLLGTVAPSSLRPVDILLKALLLVPYDQVTYLERDTCLQVFRTRPPHSISNMKILFFHIIITTVIIIIIIISIHSSYSALSSSSPSSVSS